MFAAVAIFVLCLGVAIDFVVGSGDYQYDIENGKWAVLSFAHLSLARKQLRCCNAIRVIIYSNLVIWIAPYGKHRRRSKAAS